MNICLSMDTNKENKTFLLLLSSELNYFRSHQTKAQKSMLRKSCAQIRQQRAQIETAFDSKQATKKYPTKMTFNLQDRLCVGVTSIGIINK